MLVFCLYPPLTFSSGYENLWDLPDVEAVDWSDMGLSIPCLSAILRPFPAREKRMAISHCSYICMIEQSGSKDPYAAFGGNMAALQRKSSDCGRSKDPYAAFGGNMAALQRIKCACGANEVA